MSGIERQGDAHRDGRQYGGADHDDHEAGSRERRQARADSEDAGKEEAESAGHLADADEAQEPEREIGRTLHLLGRRDQLDAAREQKQGRKQALNNPQRDADSLAHIVSSPCKRPGTRSPACTYVEGEGRKSTCGSIRLFCGTIRPVHAMTRAVHRRSRGLARLAFCIILLSARAGFGQYNTAEISGSSQG